jgi:glycosyltransferase involved in cell wall biosynthesis
VGISAFYKNIFQKKMIYRTASLIDVDKSWINTNGLAGKFFRYGLENTDVLITQNKEHQHLVTNNHKIKALVLKNAFVVQNYQQVSKDFCLWVSRFDSMKKPDLFLKLAAQIPTEKFVMICPYNPSDYKKWMSLKQRAEKIPNLTFIEKVPFHEIQDYFNQAKAFVNTSDYEGFPNTFLQAAQGKAPIVSLNVNPDNFLNEYDCGYFCENKFELLLEKTKQLLQNPDEIKQKGKKAYLNLKENHDINIIGKHMEEIIYQLAEN